MRPQRIEEIKNYIYENKTVTLNEICKSFHISKSTLRRDLNMILQPGDRNIIKIYGGVTALSRKELMSFDERNSCNLHAKRRIAEAAAALVQDNDTIFIDSGTTTLPIPDYIKGKENVTILTNSVEIVLHAIPYETMEVISLSGVLNRRTLSFIGTNVLQTLQNYNISKAFMAATGFSIASGLTDPSLPEAQIKRLAVQHSRQIYLLADSSKCGKVSLVTYCDMNQIDMLITEAELPREYTDYFEKSGKKILIAR